MNNSDVSVSDTVVFSESDHASLIRSLVADAGEETPTKKKGNRRKSGIWSLFTAVDRDFALCNICDVRFSYRTSISNLKKHLLNKHCLIPPPALHKILRETPEESPPGGENNERNGNGCDRVQVKKEKIVTESSNRNSRVYLDECVVDSPSLMRYSNEKEMRDEFDAIGVTIAAKLRKMDERQRLFCEKIINEALFKGAFEQLCPTSELVVYHVSTSPMPMAEDQEVRQTHVEESSITINSENTSKHDKIIAGDEGIQKPHVPLPDDESPSSESSL